MEHDLHEGEEVVDWARARDPDTNKEGFAYLTPRRLLVHWKSRRDGLISVRWDDVESWGVDKEHRRGPVLRVRTDHRDVYIQLQTGSKALAVGAARFVRRFARLAPSSRDVTHGPRRSSRFQADGNVHVQKEKRTPAELTRRIVVTVVGVGLIVTGLAVVPLPGPWSFVINIAGLALLATEYDWAQDLLDWARTRYKKARDHIRARRQAED